MLSVVDRLAISGGALVDWERLAEGCAESLGYCLMSHYFLTWFHLLLFMYPYLLAESRAGTVSIAGQGAFLAFVWGSLVAGR